MQYRRFSEPGPDASRAHALASILAIDGVDGIAGELVQAGQAIREGDAPPEVGVRIGVLLGFNAVAVGSKVTWQLDCHSAGGTDPLSLRHEINYPDEQSKGEIASAAGRLSTLLGELGWRTRLPDLFVTAAIGRGFSRHGLSTEELFRRSTRSGGM